MKRTQRLGCPDLVVGDVSFSKTSPAEGENVELSAVIKNVGRLTANTVKVGFYEPPELDETNNLARRTIDVGTSPQSKKMERGFIPGFDATMIIAVLLLVLALRRPRFWKTKNVLAA